MYKCDRDLKKTNKQINILYYKKTLKKVFINNKEVFQQNVV